MNTKAVLNRIEREAEALQARVNAGDYSLSTLLPLNRLLVLLGQKPATLYSL